MKTIGIIGGMSYESTVHYYERINRQVNARLGGLSSAKMLLYNVDFAEVRALMIVRDWANIGIMLSGIAQKLERAGADCIVIASNTIHRVADDVQRAVSIPLLHIADGAAAFCKRQNIAHVGLLGTRYTMEETFLADRLRQNGIAVDVPDTQAMRLDIDRIIFDELCKGDIRPASRAVYIQAVQEMMEKHGIEAVLMGCTEIEMLLKEGDVPVPLIDSLAAHIEAIVAFALGDEQP